MFYHSIKIISNIFIFLGKGVMDSTKEAENVLVNLKEELKNMPPAQEFFDFKKYKIPKSFDECQEKSKKNFPKFKGNYLALGILFGIMYLLFNPYSVILFSAWLLYLYFHNKEEVYEIKGMKITPKHLLFTAIAVTLICFVLFNKVFINFLILFSIYFIILVTHLFTYEIEDELKDVAV